MKKHILPFLLFLITLTACESDNLDPCIKGKVFFYENCFNVLIIEVLDGNLEGDSVDFFGFKGDNMVQFPMLPDDGFLQVPEDSIFYFNYRLFDPDKDEYPTDDDFCTANIGPLDIPTILITNYSATNCPINNEN